MEAIIQAQRMHKRALEETYDGKCTITNLESVKDPESKITSKKPVIICEDQPCKLSIQSSPAVGGEGAAAKTMQSIKLILSPDLAIKAGSRIVVTQNGITAEYKRSGVPAVYASHQEIELELAKEWV